MRRDDGYTLAECLVAMFVVGLAVSGLSAGLLTVSKMHGASERLERQDQSVRTARQALDGLLAQQGPFASPGGSKFNGDSKGFRFECGPAKAICGSWVTTTSDGLALTVADQHARHDLPLPGFTGAKFNYAGSLTLGPTWPAQIQDPQTLRSIGLVGETRQGVLPVASVRVWIDQPTTCAFDAIAQACR